MGSVSLLAQRPAIAQSAEWTKITENSVKDRFFVDTSSIQRDGAIAWYWEYREFPEANNALLEAKVDQPVHGAVMRWSVDCSTQSQRLRKLNAYTTNRKLIQKFEYGDTGMMLQPKAGSSTYKVMDYVCRSQQKK
ncbi:MAG: hypothetical protein C4288_10000 [Leptolyngbya sp. ERB_1_1]